MRFVKDKSGIERTRTKYTQGDRVGKIRCGFNTYQPHINKQSEDTIIRRDINKTIMDMIQEKKGRIEIEIYLTNKYPNYSEYILKMLSHRFDKQNSSKDKENDTDLGER